MHNHDMALEEIKEELKLTRVLCGNCHYLNTRKQLANGEFGPSQSNKMIHQEDENLINEELIDNIIQLDASEIELTEVGDDYDEDGLDDFDYEDCEDFEELHECNELQLSEGYLSDKIISVQEEEIRSPSYSRRILPTSTQIVVRPKCDIRRSKSLSCQDVNLIVPKQTPNHITRIRPVNQQLITRRSRTDENNPKVEVKNQTIPKRSTNSDVRRSKNSNLPEIIPESRNSKEENNQLSQDKEVTEFAIQEARKALEVKNFSFEASRKSLRAKNAKDVPKQ
jgi:hypothetical protein